MGERDRTHLFISQSPTNEAFQQVVGGGASGARPLPPDRRKHGVGLKSEMEEALDSSGRGQEPEGTYVTFESFPGVELALESLDPQSRGEQPRLVAVRYDSGEDGDRQNAARAPCRVRTRARPSAGQTCVGFRR